MNNEINAYRELQKHQDKLPIGFPPTESGIELKVLKHLFTPIEAKIATCLTSNPCTLNKIYRKRKIKKLKISKDELAQYLENMNKKGAIYGTKKGNRMYYKNQIFAVGIYEYQVNRVTKEFMEDWTQYLDEAFAHELTHTGVYQSRIIPVEKSIPHENFVYSYDDVRKIIKKTRSQIAVANCICRTGYDKMGLPCKQTDLRESCLVFRGPAKYYINHGIGRPITKEEVFEILDKAEKGNLILQPGNSKRFYFLCTCCSCCCEGLKSVLKTSIPSKMYKTNYYAEIDSNLCNLCEVCIKRCQTNAIKNENGIMKIDNDYCVGCGLCVVTCPKQAITLKKNQKQYKPYTTNFRLYMKILSKKRGFAVVIGMILRFITSFNLNYLLRKQKINQNQKN